MNCLFARLSALLILVPAIAMAGWQVAKPNAVIPSEPFFQAGVQQSSSFSPSYGNAHFSDQFANLGRPAAIYAISVSGSLKENLERIMDRYHWKVIWKVAYDYNFDGRITGSSLPNVIEKLMTPFPLQATLYMSNRTMIVTSRKL
ncbi:MAG: hypothetical protein P4M12_00545 [Gammaproteobacteria bacterium]|nr:hypothetical protein [Gammaproteobacteria bacterium]